MKKLATSFLMISIVIFCHQALAQIGAQVSFIKPSKDFGYLFKPSIGAEVLYNNGVIDDRFIIGVSIGYYTLTSRQDTFFSYGMQYGGGGTMYLPAYDIWYYYRVIPLQATFSYKILDEKFSPVAAIDAGVNLVSYHRYSYLESVRSSDETAGSIFGGLFPRVGLSYQIGENYLLSCSLGKSYNIDFSSYKSVQLWKAQMGIVYYFD